MEIVLDTSFILTCIKEKIDFFQAEDFGNMVLPAEVIGELRKIAGKKRGKEKNNAELALEIIFKNKERFKIIELEKKYVDRGIEKYAEKNKVIVATIDRELRRKLKGARILALRGRKLVLT